jgi:hypothetical protein
MKKTEFTPAEVVEVLAKALHRCIASADERMKNILAQLEDGDSKPHNSPDDVPETAEPVLYKSKVQDFVNKRKNTQK